MEIKGIRKLASIVSILGVVQFFLLTFIATLFYPEGFDYLGYFFSDLGAVMAKNCELQVNLHPLHPLSAQTRNL